MNSGVVRLAEKAEEALSANLPGYEEWEFLGGYNIALSSSLTTGRGNWV